MTRTTTHGILSCFAALFALAAGACGEPEQDGLAGSPAVQARAQAQQAASEAQDLQVPNKNGVYFVSVSAQGSGCPAGSWNVEVSADGEVFTLTFSNYELSLAPDQASGLKTLACNLALNLNSPAGTSYAVTKLAYQGYAKIERGMRAEQSAYYTFAGAGAVNVDGPGIRASKNVIDGPYDDTFMFVDNVSTTARNWSDCATERALLVETRMRLQNGTPKGAGYLNLSAIDGETGGKIILGLQTRSCPTT